MNFGFLDARFAGTRLGVTMLFVAFGSVAHARAQAQAQAQAAAARIAEGRLTRPSPGPEGRPVPVVGQWVVLHRVGSDRAGPLDSVKSGPNGRFRMRYAPSGADDALYFVSSRYSGIAYFSPPLRAAVVRGGDADIIVYDTTSDTTRLSLQGRHFVLSQARGGRRQVAEVFEIENGGTRTVIPRDSTTPLWSTHVPAEAESLSVAPGDVSAAAVAFRRGRAELYAPISPGVRQLVITYLLPAKAFPASQPMERAVTVLEVLLEEPRAEVEGARLREVAPASIDGRTFRRFLGQEVPGSAAIRVSAPPPIADHRAALFILAGAVALVMLAAVGVWSTRRRARPSHIPYPVSHVESLIGQIAALDVRYAREKPEAADARVAYEQQRALLKEQIATALAAEKQPT